MINPYALLGAGILAVSLAVGGFTFGVKYQRGQEARAEQLIARVRDEAQRGAAEAIAQIKINNTTIRQQLETQVRENTVYRDCKLDPDSFRLLNDALSGAPGQPAGGGVVSGTDTTDR
jgi:hypothetical protein